MSARPGRRRGCAGGGAAHPRQLRHLDSAGRGAGDGRDHPPRQEPAGRDADHGHGQRGHAHHPRGAGQRWQAAASERHNICRQPAHRRLPDHLRAGNRVRRKGRAGRHKQRGAGTHKADRACAGGFQRQRRRPAHGGAGCGLRGAGRDGGIQAVRGLAGRAPLRHRAGDRQERGHRRGGAGDGLQVGRAGQEVRIGDAGGNCRP